MQFQTELISIGNELLSGRTLNTHAQDLGKALTEIGLQLTRDTTVQDSMPIIGTAMTEAFARVNLVFISGGLGPTVDDITRDALAKVLNQDIILHRPTVENITQRYDGRGRTMTPAAERQALVLEKAIVLPNSAGAAPGQRIDLPGNQYLFILPGPPKEFNAILNEEIVPWLKETYKDARPNITRSIWTQGIYESDMVMLLNEHTIQPENVEFGFYPANGKVEIRITANPDHIEEADSIETKLRQLLKEFLYSEI